jgi:hypothetical protein
MAGRGSEVVAGECLIKFFDFIGFSNGTTPGGGEMEGVPG